MPTVIYLVERLNWERDSVRFGVQLTRTQNVQVELWDLAPILLGAQPLPAPSEGCRVISSWRSLFSALRSLHPATTLVVALLGYQANTWVVFFLLSRFKLRYGLSRTNVVPGSHLPASALWRRILRPTFRMLMNLLLHRVPATWLGISPASYLFLGGEKSAVLGKVHRYIVSSKTEAIWVHQLDFELYLDEETAPSDPVTPTAYAVFLDEHMPYHWELAARGWGAISATEYYAQINRVFLEVEERLGLTVVVAAHPSADYATRGNPFHGRRLLQDSTVSLVRGAQLVLAHSTTALNFAVLYEKPIVMLKPPGLSGTILGVVFDSMAQALRLTPVDMSEADSTAIIQATTAIPDREGYRRDYIKKPGSSMLRWGLVVGECALRLPPA